MRLIEADPLHIATVQYIAENAYLNDTALDALKMIARWMRDAPTIEAEPVRHSKWETIELTDPHGFMVIRRYKCPLCGRYEAKKEPYCHCGAKMDGGEDA